MKDGWRNQVLQKCKTCGVCVHETCYGLAATNEKNPEYACKACAAVGTTVPVRTQKGPNSVLSLTQVKRPTECAFCSVSDGIHAMHPVYDTHGRTGRQHVLPADEKKGIPQRLAWAHSLCAFIICQKGGLVFACDRKGRYVDENGEWYQSDDESDSSDDSDEDWRVETHHFVECGKVNGQHTRYSWDIKKKQAELICSVCGVKDDRKGSLRFALQCTAGDEDEFFFEDHPEISAPCTVAIHVGCAMWGEGSSSHRRVYFYPGEQPDADDEVYSDPVAEFYCSAHAQDIGSKEKKKKKVAKQKGAGVGKKLAAKGSGDNPSTPRAPRRNLAFEKRVKRKEPATGRKSPVPAKRASVASYSPKPEKRIVADLARPLKSSSKPAHRITDVTKPQRIERRQTLPIVVDPKKSADEAVKPDGKSQRRHSAPNLNPLGNIEKLAFPSKRPSSTDQTTSMAGNRSGQSSQGTKARSKKADSNPDWLSIITEDVLSKIASARMQGTSTPAATKECRKRWSGTTGLPKSEFKQLWNSVKEHVRKALSTENATESVPTMIPAGNTEPAEDEYLSASTEVAREGSEESRWRHLWVGDQSYSGDFEFGDWDSRRVSQLM